MALTFLLIGDVVGKIGRDALKKALPGLKARYSPNLTIANAENLAHGRGVTRSTLKEVLDAGVDLCTSGNHVYDNAAVSEVWTDPILKEKLIRPANFPDGMPGKGWKMLELGGKRVLVINLICTVFMGKDSERYGSPFEAFDRLAAEHPADAVVVDLHGEATSERLAFGFHADGRAAAVFGTHTHVPTADARIYPKGTAYVTDVGMTGARWSVLGVSPEGPMSLFLPGSPKRFEIPETGPVDLNALVVRYDENARESVSIEPIHEIVE